MEENKITPLTDEQIDMITEALAENASDQTTHLREIIAEGENDDKIIPYNTIGDKSNLVQGEAIIEIDPDTGEKKIALDQSKLNSKVAKNIDLIDMTDGSDDIKLAELNDENMKESLKAMDMSDEEALAIITIIRKDMEGIEIKYEELPKVVQQMVDSLKLAGAQTGTKRSTKTVVKDVIGFLRTQLQMDQELIEFQDVLKKEMKMPSLLSMYNEETDELMSTKIIELADKVEKESPEKAKLLRRISDSYEDAKNFTTITRVVKNQEKPAKKLQREIKRFNKYIREFNYKYNEINTKFTIDSLQIAEKVLVRHTLCSPDKAKMFLILFCKLCMNMNPNDVADHTYMYYTLKTITTLDAYERDDEVYLKNKEHLCNILEKLN